jgi:hypothetical protein
LIDVVDALPATRRDRKLAVLDRAALHARAAPDPAQRLWRLGDAAELLYELGAVEKAKALFAEGLRTANQMSDKTEYRRAYFAAQLIRVDAPAALAIAKDFQGVRVGGSVSVIMGLRLVEQDPVEAERFWKEAGGGRRGTLETFCWKMARVDPARARRIIERFPWIGLRPELFLFLALGLREPDESAAQQALGEGLRLIDRLMRDQPERYQFIAGSLLPIVERIDPARVPEVFWRDAASRPPVGNPRTISAYSPSQLIHRLAWYDREVAAALFEPSRIRMEHTEDGELATWENEFLAWSFFDPRAAVARLEQVPVSQGPGYRANAARLRVASFLGLPFEARWRRVPLWGDWSVILGGPRRR